MEKGRCFRISRLLGFLPMERLSLNHGQTQSRAKNCPRQICIFGFALRLMLTRILLSAFTGFDPALEDQGQLLRFALDWSRISQAKLSKPQPTKR
jgi:hypothetical protein